MDDRQKERLAELYQELPRDQLAQAGKRFLDGDLRLRSARQRRWFWAAFAVAIAVMVFTAILLAVYLLEKTAASADTFERGRAERMRQQGLDDAD